MVPQAKPAPGIAPPLVAFGGRVDRATLKPHNKQADNGWLQAWDPVARKVVWETPKGPRATSGALATGGNLVFMGNSGGKQIRAYDARTGAELWNFEAQTAVFAAPITYELDGVQYIAASVGGAAQGGDYFAPTYARMLVFKVGGKAVLPANKPYTPLALNPPPSTATADVIAHGGDVYTKNCAVCHGAGGTQQRTSFPNLTVTPLLYSQAGFDQVVLGGMRADKGMGSFAKDVSATDAVAVREYLISRANEIKRNPPAAPGGFGGPPPGAAPPAPTRPATPATPDVHEEAAKK
jgi:mono/diheme cytochrome c family protein